MSVVGTDYEQKERTCLHGDGLEALDAQQALPLVLIAQVGQQLGQPFSCLGCQLRVQTGVVPASSASGISC